MPAAAVLSPQAADDCTYNNIAYEFVKEALLLYECEISEAKAQASHPLTLSPTGCMLTQCDSLF